jgi:hypothetical protein
MRSKSKREYEDWGCTYNYDVANGNEVRQELSATSDASMDPRQHSDLRSIAEFLENETSF